MFKKLILFLPPVLSFSIGCYFYYSDNEVRKVEEKKIFKKDKEIRVRKKEVEKEIEKYIEKSEEEKQVVLPLVSIKIEENTKDNIEVKVEKLIEEKSNEVEVEKPIEKKEKVEKKIKKKQSKRKNKEWGNLNEVDEELTKQFWSYSIGNTYKDSLILGGFNHPAWDRKWEKLQKVWKKKKDWVGATTWGWLHPSYSEKIDLIKICRLAFRLTPFDIWMRLGRKGYWDMTWEYCGRPDKEKPENWYYR